MVFSESSFAMLLTHEKWGFFTKKPMVDAHHQSEVMLAISGDNRQAVDIMAETARANGGKADVKPEAGSWFHVRPQLRRPGWLHLGDHVRGYVADAQGGLTMGYQSARPARVDAARHGGPRIH
jgi:hypothetical protein